MSKQASKRFGGSSGVSVRATARGQGILRTRPIAVNGLTPYPTLLKRDDAARLCRRLCEALAYLEQHGA